jgi:flagellar biogenesis protein FliO
MSPLAGYLLETLITLAAVVALAVAFLYGARRVGIGRPTGPLELVGRLPLDNRRAVYLVRVRGTLFVLGASEAGLHKLGEIEAGQDAFEAVPAPPRFGEVLKGVLRRDPVSKAEASGEPNEPGDER